MNSATIKLNETILRLVKGILKAWEEWIQAHKKTN